MTTHSELEILSRHNISFFLYITSFLKITQSYTNDNFQSPTLKATGSNPAGYTTKKPLTYKEKSAVFVYIIVYLQKGLATILATRGLVFTISDLSFRVFVCV